MYDKRGGLRAGERNETPDFLIFFLWFFEEKRLAWKIQLEANQGRLEMAFRMREIEMGQRGLVHV